MKSESYILYKFVSSDPHRPTFHNPFKQDGYVYSTDTHIILRVKEDLAESGYEVLDKPVTGVVFDIINGDGKHIVLSIDSIKSGMNEIPMVPANINCPDCNGMGEVEFEYTSTDDQVFTKSLTCPICDGRGYVDNDDDEPKRDPGTFFNIDGILFRSEEIIKMAEAAHALGRNTIDIKLITGETYPYLYFKLDDGIDGLCIGQTGFYDNQKNWTVIKIEIP